MNNVTIRFNTQKLMDFSYMLILSVCFLLSPAFEVMGSRFAIPKVVQGINIVGKRERRNELASNTCDANYRILN